MENKPKIVFLGTPEFAVPVLSALIASGLAPELVITQPDRPAGRKQKLVPPPVKIVAEKHGLKILQPENKSALTEIFNDLEVDICILVAFGMIIPASILDKPRCGFINLHPSLLPQYRGSSPIQMTILNGDLLTGVSLIKLNAGVDAGPIIVQKQVSISPAETAGSLHDRLAKIGAELVIQILPEYLSGGIVPVAQDESRATYTSMIRRENGLVDWNRAANEIDRQFRAFYPWPGIFTHLDGKRLIIAKLSVMEGNLPPDLKPGEVFSNPAGGLAVKCQKGAVLLDKVQLEGKKELAADEFAKGLKIIGKILK
jgi:methionyl-tRNA formyltransferase